MTARFDRGPLFRADGIKFCSRRLVRSTRIAKKLTMRLRQPRRINRLPRKKTNAWRQILSTKFMIWITVIQRRSAKLCSHDYSCLFDNYLFVHHEVDQKPRKRDPEIPKIMRSKKFK